MEVVVKMAFVKAQVISYTIEMGTLIAISSISPHGTLLFHSLNTGIDAGTPFATKSPFAIETVPDGSGSRCWKSRALIILTLRTRRRHAPGCGVMRLSHASVAELKSTACMSMRREAVWIRCELVAVAVEENDDVAVIDGVEPTVRDPVGDCVADGVFDGDAVFVAVVVGVGVIDGVG